MASSRPSPPKKAKLSDNAILSKAKEASEIEMPWNSIAPDYFVEWINEFACAHNVVKEMMIMAILPSIAALLGPRSSIKPSAQEPYTENFSFFSLCISPPSSGKSQAFKHGIKIPLTHVEKENSRRAIFQCYGAVPRVVGKRYMEYAIQLMKYFRKQKKAIDKILDPTAMQSITVGPQLEKKVLEHAGAMVNIRILRNKYNSSSRPTKEDIADAMSRLQEEGMGVYVQSGTAMAFLKQVPTAVEAKLHNYNISQLSYKAAFCRKNFDLQKQLGDVLLSKDPLGEIIKKYLLQQQENMDA